MDKMGFQKLLIVFLLFGIFHIAIGSAERSDKKKNSGIQANEEQHELGISSELQQLRELASKESGTIILTSTKKPKQSRRKNKHHNRRRPHSRARLNKKTKTRPTDILKEVDMKDDLRKSEIIEDSITKEFRRPRNGSRGSRHLDLTAIESYDMNSKHHTRSHRRPRLHHHNKHGHHHNHKTGEHIRVHKVSQNA